MLGMNQNGFHFVINEKNSTAMITKSERKMKNIFIPRSINYQNHDYIITNICKEAFMHDNQLRSIEFAKDSEILQISKRAFERTSLKAISIPPNVKKIEEKAFAHCDQLKQFTIPINSNLKSIEKSAFFSTQIEELFIPSGITEIKNGWCDKTTKLTKIIVSPKNNKFSYINDKYLIGKSNEDSGSYDTLYMVRRDIDEIIVPSFISKISPFAMSDCQNLTTIQFSSEKNINSILPFTFYNSSIVTISLPPSIKVIGNDAFAHCTRLKSVEIHPESKISEIGEYAFYLSSIESISIPRSLKKVCFSAFQDCKKLKKVHFETNSELNELRWKCFSGSAIESITIPSSVKLIDAEVFSECTKLKSVRFRENSQLNYIGRHAFSQCAIEFVEFPHELRMVDEGAFEGCVGLLCAEFLSDSLVFRKICFAKSKNILVVSCPNAFKIEFAASFYGEETGDLSFFVSAKAEMKFNYKFCDIWC